jgi:hypothetical protein
MLYQGFFQTDGQKTAVYNHMFRQMSQAEGDLYRRMGDKFDEIRRANRDWDKLLAELDRQLAIRKLKAEYVEKFKQLSDEFKRALERLQ